MPCRATQDGWVTVESSEKMLSTGGRTEGRNINNLRYVDQFSSVTQWCLKPCHPMDCSTPGFPVHHQLPGFTQTHVHRVSDAIQPSHRLRPLLLLSSVFPNISVFSKETALCIEWPKYWSFSFSVSPTNENSGLISFGIDWFDILAVQEILKSLLQNHNLKESVLQCSAFFIV